MLNQQVLEQKAYQRERVAASGEPLFFISTGVSDKATTKFLNDLFNFAIEQKISDIHFESTQSGMVIRYRYNGTMYLHSEHNVQTAREIDHKLRSKAKFGLVDRDRTFDGKFRFESHTGKVVDVRVSLLPTIYGVSIVCRLLDSSQNLRRLDEIKMSDDVRQVFHKLISQPQGIFLICGPTGSGKTTTLYSVLQEFDPLDYKIITVEDPVEYRINGFVQCEVTQNLTFANALRSILRQDPDIILVGEVRDSETARIAVQSALTGHLVLSTLHANNSIATLYRLFDLNVDSHALSAALNAVSAQRLVPLLCPHCKIEKQPDDWEIRELANVGIAAPEVVYHANKAGCEHCVHGFHGREPVFEIFSVGPKERLAIENKDIGTFTRLVEQQPQYRPLRKIVLEVFAQGRTSIEAALSVIGEDLT